MKEGGSSLVHCPGGVASENGLVVCFDVRVHTHLTERCSKGIWWKIWSPAGQEGQGEGGGVRGLE